MWFLVASTGCFLRGLLNPRDNLEALGRKSFEADVVFPFFLLIFESKGSFPLFLVDFFF
jgi:hypothetical protein